MLMNFALNLDGAFSALADPTRRAILARLAKGEATVSELADPFDGDRGRHAGATGQGVVQARFAAATDALDETISSEVAIERGNELKAVRRIDCRGRHAPEPAERAGNADAHRTRLALRGRT